MSTGTEENRTIYLKIKIQIICKKRKYFSLGDGTQKKKRRG
jgi:hypothetical protein